MVPSEHPSEDVYGAEFGARVRRQKHNEKLFFGYIRAISACLGMIALAIDLYVPIPAAMCWLLFIPAISPPVKFPKRVRDNFFAMYLYFVKNTIKCFLAAVMCIPSTLVELLYLIPLIGLIMLPVIVMKRLGYAICEWFDARFDSIIMKMLCLRSPVKKKHLMHRPGKSRRRPLSHSPSEPSSDPSSARASTMRPSTTQLLGCGILFWLLMKIISSSELSCQPFVKLLGCEILLLFLMMKILSWVSCSS